MDVYKLLVFALVAIFTGSFCFVLFALLYNSSVISELEEQQEEMDREE